MLYEVITQLLLIPHGLLGGITTVVTKKILGQGVHELPHDEWPESLKQSGFKGTAVCQKLKGAMYGGIPDLGMFFSELKIKFFGGKMRA